MKKFARLLLTAVMLAAMLTVFAVPASASLVRIQKELEDFSTDPEFISQDCDIDVLDVPESTTLRITKGNTVIVRNKIDLKGKVEVYGTLDISQCTEKNGVDKITVGTEGNLITGDLSDATTLSQGNLAIITAVAGVAVGLVAGLLIGKKKKPKTATAEE